jgi:hypothetical protein
MNWTGARRGISRDLRQRTARGRAMYAKSKKGFHTMPRDRARALSRLGTRRVTELANDYAFTYAR